MQDRPCSHRHPLSTLLLLLFLLPKIDIFQTEQQRVVVLFEKYLSLEEEKEAAEELIKDDDGSMGDLAKEEIDSISDQLIKIEDEITPMLLSSDPRDGSNVFLEIRACTDFQKYIAPISRITA